MKRPAKKALRTLGLIHALLFLLGLSVASRAGQVAPNLEILLAAPSATTAKTTWQTAGDGERVRVLVQTQCTAQVLEGAGFEESSRVGDVVTGTVPVTLVRSLAALPCVTYVEAPTRLRSHLDRSVPAIRADRVRAGGVGSYSGLTGRDVLVGIIDSGIDLKHPDFRDETNHTRILWLWDQTVDHHPPANFIYGNECSKEQIDLDQCPQIDTAGHGTHVTGVAAGNGRATGTDFPGERYVGVAPEADLIFVKTTLETDDIVDAIAYVTARATELGRPLVVNMSFGSQFGPHDGTSLLARALNNASAPGRIFVVSAGNEGNNDPERFSEPYLHATGSFSDTVTVELPACRNEGAQNDFLYLDIWYDTYACVDIEVTSPNGYVRNASTGQVNDVDTAWTEDGYILIANSLGGVNPNNYDREAAVTIYDFFDENADGLSMPAPGIWTIRLTSACQAEDQTYHLWIYDNQFCRGDFGITSSNRSNDYLVGSPADAVRSIAVGGFTARNDWTSVDRRHIVEPDLLNDIAYFSSPGPTRDGRQKPEITAPGNLVVSSLSEEARVEYPIENIVEDGVHAIFDGTSFAAPHITGAVALFLQVNPGLDPTQVRNLLTDSAVSDTYTGEVPNHLWGYGKADVLGALNRYPPMGPEIVSVTRISPTTALVTWDEPPMPATGFLLERRAGETGDWEQAAVTSGTDRAFTDDGLLPDVPYWYRLAALFNELQSLYSTEKGTDSQNTNSDDDGNGGGCFIRTVAAD